MDESLAVVVEPWYPAWGPWVLWPLAVAALVVVVVEVVKRAFYKREGARWHAVWVAQRSHMAKAGLLMPWKAAIGAILGVLVFRAGGLFESPVLAAAAGALVGVSSFTLYDGVERILRVLPDAVVGALPAAVRPRRPDASSGEDEPR